MAFKIYTKTGDKGNTSLIGGVRVPKNNIRIDAYGTIDELNAYLGVVADLTTDESIKTQIKEIQDRLFTIGSELATSPDKEVKMKLPDLYDTDITLLENWIDDMNTELPDMRSFIIPGGQIASSHAHVARCICRRAERICVSIQQQEEKIAPLIISYLNRLSDYLFVLSRKLTQIHGAVELPWTPRT